MRLLLALMLTGTLTGPVAAQPTLRKSLQGHTDRVNSVAFSPDGKTGLMKTCAFGEIGGNSY